MSTEAEQHSKALQKLIKEDYEKEKKVTKLLLLGTGESGKSTIVKQMKILHPNTENSQGLGDQEKLKQVKIISNNILDCVQSILSAVDKFNVPLSSTSNKEEILKLLDERTEEVSTLGPELSQKISMLWQDPAVQELMRKKAQFQIIDSAEYFLNNIDRIASPDYIPTNADVLRARSITTGIITVSFQIEKLKFELVDVGGQRAERKKWIHCFDFVTAVMFIIALSEYDQMLYEDENVNRMQESLKLFTQMLTSPIFTSTPFILFLNKEDIFDMKIKHSPITAAFPEYPGPHQAKETKEFIKNKYLEADNNPKRDVYTFFTTATDTDLVKNVFNSVTDIILNKIINNHGFK